MNLNRLVLADLTGARLTKFQDWLISHGAELLVPTNQWEVVRFRAKGETCIIYKDAKGNLTFTGSQTSHAARAYKQGYTWEGAVKLKRKNTTPLKRSIRARDGDRCFFCGTFVNSDDESTDHLVPVTAGGPSHISNYVLMHSVCNMKAGPMSAPEKIAKHVAWRIEQAIRSHYEHSSSDTGRSRPLTHRGVGGGDSVHNGILRVPRREAGIHQAGAGVVPGAEQRPAEEAGPSGPDAGEDAKGRGQEGV